MTSREALKELKIVLETNPRTRKYVDIFEETLLSPLERDVILVENFKRVLSKVVMVTYQSYQPEIRVEEDNGGVTIHTLRNEIKTGEDFDVKAFSEIVDQLGFKLVNKEGNK